MGNKKNKKNKPKAEKEVPNKLSNENQAILLAYNNNLERISGAILLDKELNPPNNLKAPCVVCNKNVLSNQNGITCDMCDKMVSQEM